MCSKGSARVVLLGFGYLALDAGEEVGPGIVLPPPSGS
jgi:hypothetical protein